MSYDPCNNNTVGNEIRKENNRTYQNNVVVVSSSLLLYGSDDEYFLSILESINSKVHPDKPVSSFFINQR